jgi:hypothetical protein
MVFFTPLMRPFVAFIALTGFCLAAPAAFAMGLMIEPAAAHCGHPAPKLIEPPPAAAKRLAGSAVAQGQRDIAWAWLGSPTLRYPHTALGSPTHAGSLHVLLAKGGAELVLELPLNRVFEDLQVRLYDIDQDGSDEVVVVESDALKGAALVVFGVRQGQLKELARSPFAGSTFRWLNPVGMADFDGDGKLDLAAVITPHIGGRLTFYRYAPPHLLPFASASDVSNHRMGASEQQLAAISVQSGKRPAVIVPDMSLRALYVLRWGTQGAWQEIDKPLPLPARAERITPLAGGACLLLADQSWWRVTTTH